MFCQTFQRRLTFEISSVAFFEFANSIAGLVEDFAILVNLQALQSRQIGRRLLSSVFGGVFSLIGCFAGLVLSVICGSFGLVFCSLGLVLRTFDSFTGLVLGVICGSFDLVFCSLG